MDGEVNYTEDLTENVEMHDEVVKLEEVENAELEKPISMLVLVFTTTFNSMLAVQILINLNIGIRWY